jgi:hypothetical protein
VHEAPPRIDQARRPDADAQDGAVGERDEPVDQLEDRGQDGFAGLKAPPPVEAAPDLAPQVDDRAAEFTLGQVDRDEAAGVVDEGDEDGRLPSPRAADSDFGDEAVGLQLVDRVRDRGPRQAGGPGDVSPADMVVGVDGFKYKKPVMKLGLLRRCFFNWSS